MPLSDAAVRDMFAETIQAALVAFERDVSYTAGMARAAVAITRKRALWQARRLVREAETRAHTECREHRFDCHARSACGTGDCKFATAALARLDATAPTGVRRRPQAPHTGYSLAAAVTQLAAQGR